MPTERYIGLMSGTSRDGVDAVLAEIRNGRLRVIGHHALAYPDALRHDLASAAMAETLCFEGLGTLDARVGLWFARAANELLEQCRLPSGAIRAIGSHGQTIHHAPDADPAFTWQIGDPFRIAETTGIDTVAHFRQRDIAAGGEGAPLACAFHAAQFGCASEYRCVLNLGGIANLTWLPPAQSNQPVSGHDCGPANILLDHWIQRHRGEAFDRGGAWARSGQVHPELLQQLITDPYFRRPAPKSTGPEHFSPTWLRERHGRPLEDLPPEDVQATLAELTVEGVRIALHAHASGLPERLLVCGGGAYNHDLMQRLARALPDLQIESTERHGVPPQQVEGAAFAWLAARSLARQTGSLPEVTGARGARILGCLIPGGESSRRHRETLSGSIPHENGPT